MASKALICGISGQDGAYLSKFLLDKGYEVFGTSRDSATANLTGLNQLGVDGRVKVLSMAPNDFRSVLQIITRVAPNEIYNLAGQTSVGLSFDQPAEAIKSISMGVLNLLEAIRYTKLPTRLWNAGSSECFGDTGGHPANEATPFLPRSPYAVAKTCAHNLVTNYRTAYSMWVCTGILFNHESPLRPERFVSQKVITAASRIGAGYPERLSLGNLDIHRDWGWAPDFIEAMWMMLQQDQPADYIIATGRTVSLEYFVERSFQEFGLNWMDHVDRDSSLMRPSDISRVAAVTTRTTQELGWAAVHDVDDVIRLMAQAASTKIRQTRQRGSGDAT